MKPAITLCILNESISFIIHLTTIINIICHTLRKAIFIN